MPFGRRRLAWFSPDPRAIIPLDGLVVSRSLRRSLRRYDVRRDTAFADVMLRCADPRRPGVVDHTGVRARPTARCTNSAGRTRSSRSTSRARWSAASTASASAPSSPARRCSTTPATPPRWPSSRLVDWLTATGGRLLDVQWLTPHLVSLGAITVSRDEYLDGCDSADSRRRGRGSRAMTRSTERDRAVDHAHVLGSLHRGGLQRAVPHEPRQGPDRPVRRLRPADADRLRPRLADGPRRGRQGRRADQPPRRHAHAARRHPAGDR